MKEILKTFGFNLFLLSVVLIIFDNLSVLNISSFLNTDYLFLVGCLFGMISYLIYSKKEIKFNNIVSYFFFALLFMLILNQFLNFLDNFLFKFIVIGAALAFIYFFINKDKFQKEIEKRKEEDNICQTKRERDFGYNLFIFFDIPKYRS